MKVLSNTKNKTKSIDRLKLSMSILLSADSKVVGR